MAVNGPSDPVVQEHLKGLATEDAMRYLPKDVTPFMRKLYQIVDRPEMDAYVAWNPDNSFTVVDMVGFSRDVLPLFFNHRNFTSFVRQLNTYGFRKPMANSNTFQHPYFQRGNVEGLRQVIRRKPGSGPVGAPSSLSARRSGPEIGNYGSREEVDQLKRDRDLLLGELVRQRQEQEQQRVLIENLVAQQQEMHLRQENTNQQVDRIMGFLTTIFRNEQGRVRPSEAETRQRLEEVRANAAAAPMLPADDPMVVSAPYPADPVAAANAAAAAANNQLVPAPVPEWARDDSLEHPQLANIERLLEEYVQQQGQTPPAAPVLQQPATPGASLKVLEENELEQDSPIAMLTDDLHNSLETPFQ